MRLVKRLDGVLVYVAGASRSGKTVHVKTRVAAASRLLVWDLRGDYLSLAGIERVETIPRLVEALADCVDAPGRFVFWGDLGDFEYFCRAAYAWNIGWPAYIVVEELADVTHPGRAPDAWRRLCSKGLAYGAHIYATSQRPQETDKSSLGNATCIHCHRPAHPRDAEYLAGLFPLDPDKLSDLRTFEWVERYLGHDGYFFGSTTPKDLP